MADPTRDEIKAANQAWRKKPRRFAPKSKLGCKTCKIRRIKCDLGKPACLKCSSTGRKCDGYDDTSPTSRGSGGSNSPESDRSSAFPARTSPHGEAGNAQPLPNSIGDLMVLPAAGQTQALAMCFFEYVSIKHLNELRPDDSWRRTLMYYSQTVPAVRHAATALALVQRDHLDCGTTNRVYQLQALRGRRASKAPLFHYNQAIQHVLYQSSMDSIETMAITLLVCYLFISFDLLAGNYVQATNHLLGGVELANNIEQALAKREMEPSARGPASDAYSLIAEVTRQIRRLDTQAVIFLVHWTPTVTRESLTATIPAPDHAFASIDQAADHMQILVARVMRLRNLKQMPADDMPVSPDSPSLVKATIHAQVEHWRELFDGMLRLASQRDQYASHPLTLLLELQYIIACILLSTQEERDQEMAYDEFLPLFQKCLALARTVAARHALYSGASRPTFTPEIGFLPILYIIGVKCRDPLVRREVVGILRQQPVREAVWDSLIIALVVERMIEIEEGGAAVTSMEQIPVERRIEELSWMHVPGEEPRLELMYNMSGSMEVYAESLSL